MSGNNHCFFYRIFKKEIFDKSIKSLGEIVSSKIIIQEKSESNEIYWLINNYNNFSIVCLVKINESYEVDIVILGNQTIRKQSGYFNICSRGNYSFFEFSLLKYCIGYYNYLCEQNINTFPYFIKHNDHRIIEYNCQFPLNILCIKQAVHISNIMTNIINLNGNNFQLVDESMEEKPINIFLIFWNSSNNLVNYSLYAKELKSELNFNEIKEFLERISTIKKKITLCKDSINNYLNFKNKSICAKQKISSIIKTLVMTKPKSLSLISKEILNLKKLCTFEFETFHEERSYIENFLKNESINLLSTYNISQSTSLNTIYLLMPFKYQISNKSFEIWEMKFDNNFVVSSVLFNHIDFLNNDSLPEEIINIIFLQLKFIHEKNVKYLKYYDKEISYSNYFFNDDIKEIERTREIFNIIISNSISNISETDKKIKFEFIQKILNKINEMIKFTIDSLIY